MAPRKRKAEDDAVPERSGKEEGGAAKKSKTEKATSVKPKTGKQRAAGGSSKKATPGKTKKAATKSPAKKAPQKPEAKGTSKPEKKAETGGEKASKGADKANTSKGKKQIKNPVETITNPKEVPKGIKRDSRGRLVFPGFDKFRPTLTPKQVIQAGSFGGIYFNPMGGKKSVKYPKGPDISADEFPKDWFEGLRDEQYIGSRYNVKLNKYGVKSGQTQQQWEEQGWIKEQDQRGWFQWYCRFTQGRRTADDNRQISRWVGVAGPKGRWKTRLVNMVRDKGGVDHVQDASISPVIRQNLLHWAYELTPQDFEAMA